MKPPEKNISSGYALKFRIAMVISPMLMPASNFPMGVTGEVLRSVAIKNAKSVAPLVIK